MEKYTMLMDRKNQYSENEYTTQSNLEKENLQTMYLIKDFYAQYPNNSKNSVC